jgi:hypothetical protein
LQAQNENLMINILVNLNSNKRKVLLRDEEIITEKIKEFIVAYYQKGFILLLLLLLLSLTKPINS